ncbi:MAG TPA: amidohydrolase family protein [Candidatus Udaeobacter sp.]|nr:amidohydrolase family protein [Candidatus Udaeobacter sp.]
MNSARKRRLVLFVAGFFIGVMACAEEADVLFTNGNIYTVNDRQLHAEAVAVKGARIVFVGSDEHAKKFHAGKIVDLHGRTVVPGFTDSHCHIFGIGEREMRLNLEGTDSLKDFLVRVKERVDKTGPSKWITGRGWIETFWKPPQFPTCHDLDKIAPNNPVFLTRADGHASVANSAALKIAKIDKNTPNPFGGQILKTNGEPNGMLVDNARGTSPNPLKASAERRCCAESTARLSSAGAKSRTLAVTNKISTLSGKHSTPAKSKFDSSTPSTVPVGMHRIFCATDLRLTRSIIISPSARSK